MFRFAPAPRDGETLYSVLARLGRSLNGPEAALFMRELMGRRHAVASSDLPGGLSTLLRHIDAASREAAVDRVIDRLTAFPFHTAFVPQDVRHEVRAAMRGDVTGVYTRLGLATFKVRPAERLRFCPVCLDEMEAERGDLWWRREHQLPGVPVCPTHGAVLRLSSASTGDRNRHSFVAATRAVCTLDADLAITVTDTADLERLTVLARLAAALLDAPPLAASHAETMEGYRSRLADVGLMRSARKVDHAALLTAFRERWGGVSELIPGLELGEASEPSWLVDLVRSGRRAAHPLQHLMLTAVLDGLEPIVPDRPFGPGPWACRNPVADHHGRAVIHDVAVRRDRDVLYGDFACSCGYLYTVARASDGSLGAPRYRRFGPLLKPALEAALERGDGLRRTAATLGLDPKTLMREAAMAGLRVPWNTSASGVLPVVSAHRPPARSTPRRRRSGPKRNWFAIDTRMARSAKRAVVAIEAERPPVRVTVAEVERRVARRDWVVKRRAKLPQTVAAMAGAIEGTEAFRVRRLDWSVQMAVASGDLRPCEVLRAAGLPTSWMPRVRDALAAVQLRGRTAA